jgi:hypothetical protein
MHAASLAVLILSASAASAPTPQPTLLDFSADW